MKHLATLFVCMLAARSLAAPPAASHAVILISVDGLAHYYFDDPNADMPTLRQLAAEGARARRMKVSLPSVTWPNHTTLVTGVRPARHGVLANNYLDRATAKVVDLIYDPIFTKEQIVKVPTVYDLAKSAGMTTAAITWPASRGAPTLDWTLPDVLTDELFQGCGTPSLLAELKQTDIPYDKHGQWHHDGHGADLDRMRARILVHILRAHRPNLALLHIDDLDTVEHAHGPRTPQAYAALKFEDDRVREVWDALKASYPGGTATLMVTADHGFFATRQQVLPNVMLRKAGLIELKGISTIASARVLATVQGGSAFIYVLDSANRAALMEQAAALFKDAEGIDRVILPTDYKHFGIAEPQNDPRMPDLVLSAKDGYSFSDRAAGEAIVTPKSADLRGTHGYDTDQLDMHATFIAWGAGIKPGTTIDAMENVDVAPTVAKLLGIKMEGVEGKVLEGMLAK
jgi:predicted AlkP superfamily pyrophosphatase or phosphodiesterase